MITPFDGVGLGVIFLKSKKSYISKKCASIKCLKTLVFMRVSGFEFFGFSEKIGSSTDGVGQGDI